MPLLVAMYNLRKGVTMDDYKKFSRDLDQITTSRQPGVKSFKVYEIKPTDDQKPKYQIYELIDVESWDAWQKVLKSPAFKPGTRRMARRS